MKPFNKEEYNKLCADFLGWESLSPKTKYCYWKFPEELCFKLKHSEPVHSNNLVFDSDWNWIMEVVEKIESTSIDFHGRFQVFISFNNCNIQGSKLNTTKENPCYAYFNDCYADSKKEAVVQAIWEFLQWYNTQ